MRTEAAFIRCGAIHLAGTLTLPARADPLPLRAVILVSGSGQHDRDETVCGKKPFAVIARHLALHGIASLRYDDRGVGESGGYAQEADFESSVRDLIAVHRHLADDPRVLAESITYLGHSEGGLAAADASFSTGAPVIMLAGPAIAIETLLHQQAWWLSFERGATQAQLDHERRMNERVFEIVRRGDPEPAAVAALVPVIRDFLERWPGQQWTEAHDLVATAQTMASIVAAPAYQSLLRQDPAAILERVRQPILALFAELDRQVDAQLNRAAFDHATRANSRAGSQILPGLNHLFQRARTGSIDEYEELGQAPAPEVLERIVRWLRSDPSGVDAAGSAFDGT